MATKWQPRGELIRYTEREQLLLDLLEQGTLLSLNRYCRQTGISRRAAEHLLAKFVRYDIVEPVFENHKFYFRNEKTSDILRFTLFKNLTMNLSMK